MSDAQESPQRKAYMRAGAIIAVLLALLFVILLLISRGRDEAPSVAAPTASATPIAARIISPQELRAIPAQVGHEVYWAGDDSGKSLELTVTSDGGVYVRYLPNGAKAGATQTYLTVVTYPRQDAYALVKAGGDRPRAVSVTDAGGALVTAEGPEATNAYFAFENVPLLIEVFDPEPGRAFERIQSGQIQMVQ